MSGTVIRAAIKGFPVKLISIGLRSSFHVLVARPNYKSITELKGKKIAVSNIGATDEIVTRFILQKGGLDPKKDVVILSVGGSEIRYQSLVSGQTDATALSLPHSLIAKQQGYRILGVSLGCVGDTFQRPWGFRSEDPTGARPGKAGDSSADGYDPVDQDAKAGNGAISQATFRCR